MPTRLQRLQQNSGQRHHMNNVLFTKMDCSYLPSAEQCSGSMNTAVSTVPVLIEKGMLTVIE